jgi:hypothetical protein
MHVGSIYHGMYETVITAYIQYPRESDTTFQSIYLVCLFSQTTQRSKDSNDLYVCRPQWNPVRTFSHTRNEFWDIYHCLGILKQQ